MKEQAVTMGDLSFEGVDLAAARIITATIEGIVDEDDLRALASGATAAIDDPLMQQAIDTASQAVDDPNDLKKIREKHHSVARLMASGMTQRLVASISGYTESYLSILLNNPSMQELIALYRAGQGQAAQVIAEKLRTVGLQATEKLASRLDDPEAKVSTADLVAMAKLGLDRSGHGPQHTNRNINENHSIDHAAILEQQRKAKAGSREFIVPVAEVRAALTLEHKPASDTDEQAELPL